jgi:glutamate formiminotransferase/formiminotetrahydrofolate cyclodeaminase
MEECVECANEFGRRLAEEVGVPVYLYEEAARADYRRKMPDIRRGEYEALEEKLKLDEWKPDYGDATFVPEWGATVTGARFFLVAYNINIIGTSNQAHRIALDLRTKGRGPKQPGKLQELQGQGWFVDEYNMAQFTMNIMNYNTTPIHTVFEETKRIADEINVAVAGSELVGLIPLDAMLAAADYYMEKENLFILDEAQKIKLVIERLGLNSIAPFIPEKRIIEYMIKEERNEPLASLTTRGFIEEIAARSSAPGGGSAAAAIAAIGAGLGTMVAQLTYGVRKFEHLDAQIRAIIPPLNATTQKLIAGIDADTDAFNDYMNAIRMPKKTEEEQALRHQAMQDGLKTAIKVPLQNMKDGDEAWNWMIEISKIGNINSKSDVEVGAKSLETGIWGAYKNVVINMKDIEDQNFITETMKEADAILARAHEKAAECIKILDERSE